MGKFPRSMSDFKPGERNLEPAQNGNLRTVECNGRSPTVPGFCCNPSVSGFIMCSEETHGTV